ncbi:hypothetical protein [Corynebacterium sp. LK28]|uniref:hypothetical protein n=1 Tax=Corynebacterium sp. LK28 TaxID=2044579 RepID=UPI001651DE93|nr:hypothetical protein [Corynebacterium sp. LK28]MBC6795103.1 hypothetical protein [Corynebacterium sp. LK28]
MKFKKSLVTLAAASSVAMAGIPAATAEEAPAAQDAPAAAATENEAGNNEAGADETKPADEAKPEDESKPANGSADSEKGQKLKGSIDKLMGWDESTSVLKKIQDVMGFIGKIVKTFAGIPGSSK